jgi:copper homeostasis protein
MAVGGTTVSYGVAEDAIRRCHAAGIKVMSMIRPRGGNFVYNETEFAVMTRDIEMLSGLRTDGYVFGCLTESGSLDREKILRLIRTAESNGATKAAAGGKKLDLVFHMAFDHINYDEQPESLRWLAENGITRILTHGSADQSIPIQNNYRRLREYIAASQTGSETSGIEILAGGGVTKDNYREICAELQLTQAHGSRIL